MSDDKKVTRRDFLTLASAAGAFSLVRPGAAAGEPAKPAASPAEPALPQVPRRVLGKTGVSIPILLFGGAVDLDPRFDPKMAEALRFGVNYLDAADCYNGGKCETAVGNFHERAKVRDKIWITTKSDAHDPEGLKKTFATSLEKLKTDHVDMLFLHALKEPEALNDEMRKTAEELKKQGKTRFFGFSCHDGNVAELLELAATKPWIDAVMFRYNFRQYGDVKLSNAMNAAHKAGVGLIAMKTQASEASFAEAWKKYEQTGKWTKHQAVLKAVWADERITAAVSHMDTFDKLKENIAAAVDTTKLGTLEQRSLERYAAATRAQACDGCEHICNPTVAAPVRIGTTLRYLMYHDAYGETARAREAFRRLPLAAQAIHDVNFAPAAAACPHGVNVAGLMKRAAEVLA